jgi:hypothetical protein
MIVWGGGGTSPGVTGGRYQPSSDTWTATSAGTGVPSARQRAAAVWTGSEMIVWGGWDGQAPLRPEAGTLQRPDTWAATSVGLFTPSPRYRHTAIWTGTGDDRLGGQVRNGNRREVLCNGLRLPATPTTSTRTPTGTEAP